MAINKKNEFSLKHQSIADFAKALSHPARVLILKTIAEKKECICGEIVDVIPLAQSTVSQHLKELKKIGLIKGEIEGLKSCYCINWKKLEEFEQQIEKFLEAMNEFKDKEECC